MPAAYSLSDRATDRISKKILEYVRKAKRKLSVLGFDELNVLKETDSLYSDIERMSIREMERLYRERYEELYLFLEPTAPKNDLLDDLVDLYFAVLLGEPNETTHYAFEPELKRKRDRAKEAVNAVPTRAQKQIELDKAARFIIQQTAWYCDFTSQAAEIQAMKDAGVKKVRRHEESDDKVCALCRSLDGKVYDIGRIPALEHLNCRRYFEPYK